MSDSDGGTTQANLTEKILRVGELARTLRELLTSRFVKEDSSKESGASEAVEPNPIQYLIRKSQETQDIMKDCLEIIQSEIINKLEGK